MLQLEPVDRLRRKSKEATVQGEKRGKRYYTRNLPSVIRVVCEFLAPKYEVKTQVWSTYLINLKKVYSLNKEKGHINK